MFDFLRKHIHQSWFVVWACLGIVMGVILGAIFKIGFFVSTMWVFLAVGALVWVYLIPRMGSVIIALVAGMILALFRISDEVYDGNYIKQFYGQEIQLMGVVDGDPGTSEKDVSFKLKNLRFGEGCTDDDGDCYNVSGSLYVSGGKDEALMRGDTIILSGKLTEGFGTFAGYMYKPRLLRIIHPEPGDLILKIRNWFAGRIKDVVSEPEVNLGLSYLLGMKTGLTNELNEKLRMVGLVHIVVASGAHLSILVKIARRIFGKISRFAGTFFATFSILSFMVMIGFTPSIMRAGIMSILVIAAQHVGRKFAAWRIILIVAAITLMMDPAYIINLGWLLSFASFVGIMIVGPKLTNFFYGAKKPKFVASTIITTVAATLMTLPITLYYFGTFSLISVVANLLILPTLPYAMGLTFVTGIFSGIPWLGTMVSFLTTKLLAFHILVVNFFGEMKQFIIEIQTYQAWVFSLYIVIFISLIIGLIRRKMLKLKEEKKIKWEKKMSGHSKWATTKRQKAVVDAKRGALFTKIGNQIAIAARSGTDPAMNPSLAMVLEKARLANMPKVNIERAIQRVADKSAATLIEEVYEAYGPGGVGIVIEVATDNKNRTMPEVRHTLDKNGGRMADPGSVMFQFKRKGVIEISEKGEDALMMALEAGAEDANEEDDGIVIYTEASDLMKVKKALDEAGTTVTSAELQYVPTSYVPIEGENAEKLEKLLASIDDLDDVTNVYTNAE